MPDDAQTPIDEPLNREQRRAARYRPNAGKPDAHAIAAAETAMPGESAGRGGDDDGAFAGGRGTDVTRQTGTGSGGATESDGRVAQHEGVHRGRQPNS